MEINISKIVNTEGLSKVTGSVMRLGKDAAKITWQNALNLANQSEYFNAEQLAAIRKYLKTFGAWTAEEIEAFNATEVTALMLQLIASEVEENGPNFEEGNIFKTSTSEFFYYVGS